MSRVVLATVGTTGDVLPYRALARALLSRGHSVRVATHELHRPLFAQLPVDFTPAAAPLAVESFNALVDTLDSEGEREPVRHFERLVEKLLLAGAKDQMRAHLEASAGADVVVAHRFDYVAQEAAIQGGKPWVSVGFVPDVIPTDEAPPHPYPDLGRWFARRVWSAAEAVSAPFNARVLWHLKMAGGKPRKLGLAGASSPYLNLIAAPRALVDARDRWPDDVILTGAWFDDEPGFEPDPPLASWLAEHPEPVVVSFGSMGGSKAKETTDLLIEALAGRPAIIQRGYAELGREVPGVLEVGYVPHRWLFSRAGCVIHHAGAGTAAAVARAGVPSVAVPHLFDQYYWAGMLAKRKVAPKPIFRRDLDASQLAKQIARALGMRRRAKALGEAVRAERGVDTAVEAIERLVARASQVTGA